MKYAQQIEPQTPTFSPMRDVHHDKQQCRRLRRKGCTLVGKFEKGSLINLKGGKVVSPTNYTSTTQELSIELNVQG